MDAKDAMINHSTVLRYIQHSLTTSRFAVFFNEIGTSEDPWGTFRKGESIFETIDHHLRQFVDESSEGSQTPRKTSLLLPIAGLFMHLDTQSTTVFSQIAEAEKRNVIFGSPITIQTPMADSPVAMTTISMDASQRGLSHNYIAFLEKEGTLRIVQIKLQTENGVSTYVGGKVAGGLIEGKVMDLAFLDNSLVCLVHEKNAATGAIGSVIMMGSVVDCGVELPAGVTKEPAGVKIHEGEHAWRGVLLELLKDQISWLPEHMKIVPADGTSAAKILLSGENGTKYKVLQMD
jgi:anaphase-promoting complex subunit 4